MDASLRTTPKLRAGKRIPAALITITLLVALSPVLENWKTKPEDSFPLSYYPMFSFRRGSTFTGQTLAGIQDNGERVLLPYKLAGTGGFNQVRRQIATRLKNDGADELCEHIARRIAKSGAPEWSRVQTVEVLTAKHRVDDFFAGDRTPVKEKLHARCTVPGTNSLAKSERR